MFGFVNIRQNGVIYNMKEKNTFWFKKQRKNERENERHGEKERGRKIDAAVSKNAAPEQVFPNQTGNMKWYYLRIAQAKIGKHVSGNISILLHLIYTCEQASERVSVVLLGAMQTKHAKRAFLKWMPCAHSLRASNTTQTQKSNVDSLILLACLVCK